MKKKCKSPWRKGTKKNTGKGCFGSNKATKTWEAKKKNILKNRSSSLSRALKSGNRQIVKARQSQITGLLEKKKC